MQKATAVLLCCLLSIFFLTGCGSQISFTWVVDQVPSNLDPQLAAGGSELTAVTNLYSGLVRLDAEGKPQPECADHYEISPDGLTYTFTLNPDLTYQKLKHHEKEYSLTAHDFVFAFQRIFRQSTESPYTSTFSAIQNSQKVLSGELPESMLGVTAPDDTTVIFQLSQKDPEFLHKLALPGAMPCNQEFFESTRGAYGLMGSKSVFVNVLANGPFRLYNWNENGIFLRRPGNGQMVTSLRIVINATGTPATSDNPEIPPLTGADLVTDGNATAALSNHFEESGLTSIPYTATTWALVMNTENSLLAQPQLRQALAAAIDPSVLVLPQGCQHADGLVPPAVSIDGRNYRDAASSVLPQFADPVELARAGLAAAGASRFSDIFVIFPADQNCLPLVETLNQQWQKQLGPFSAYFSLKELSAEDFEKALRSGDFQLALVPFSPASDSALSILEQTQISRLTYGPSADLLHQLRQVGSPSLSQISEAERLILADAAVVPLWYQRKSLVSDPAVTGLVFRPFGPVLDLTWTSLKK